MRLITIILLFFAVSVAGQTSQKRTFWNDGSFSWNVVIAGEDGTQKTTFDVAIQDQTTDIVDQYLCTELGRDTLAVTVAADVRTITLQAGHSFVVGNFACMRTNGNWYQGRVISVNGNDITLDQPTNRQFLAGTIVRRTSPDMNINGSVNRVVFAMQAPTGTQWDITRMIIIIRDDAAMDDGKFGGLTELTNGVMFRKKNGDGTFMNLFAARNNGQFAARTYDADYTSATTGPSGQYGLRIRRSFNGFDKNGVVIRLDGDTQEQFQVIIQDNLTGLTHMRVVIQGHLVED
jgi:hypothetical protein